MQIFFPQLSFPNPNMWYVFLYVQVEVLIAFGRYICMKKKLTIIIY